MQSVVREEKKRPLSYEMLETLLPKWCRVTKYDSLKNVKTLKEALKGSKILVVLYNLHDRISKKLINAPGHFILINTAARGQPIEYFSSLGWSPGKELSITHSDASIFKRLLGNNFIHNTVAFQRSGDINTCWRWILIRSVLATMPLAKFQKLFASNVNLRDKDDMAVLMTLLTTATQDAAV